MSSLPRPSRRRGILAHLGAVVVAALVLSLGGIGALSAQAVGSPPTVIGVASPGGPVTGGTTMTIFGTNFTNVLAVTVGGIAASTYSVDSDTQITATSPAHPAGIVDVFVTTVDGTSAASLSAVFRYLDAPTLTGLSPAIGPAAGGTVVTITGTNFTGAFIVSFGATIVPIIVNSPTSITVTTPGPMAPGAIDVFVVTPGGGTIASAASKFTYALAPTVTAVAPNAGSTSGGTAVTITGTAFTAATAVTFGGTAATDVVVVNDTQITATAPEGTGTVDVRVTAPGGTSATSASDLFTYSPVATLNLSSSSVDAGGTVTVSGSGFAPNTAFDVVLHSTPVTLTTVTTSLAGTFSVAVTIPAGIPAGAHTIVAGGASIALTVVDPALAATGNDPSAPLGLAAGLLAIGLLLTAAAVRRRRAVPTAG